MEKDCPCCSGKTYQNCCGPYLSGELIPDTAEKLMRSRYSAFAEHNISYIHETMREKALKDADMAGTQSWAESCKWIKLEVKNACQHQNKTDMAEVSFVATYEQNGKLHHLHENSLFKKEEKRWFYIGSVEEYHPPVQSTKVGRNEPCPCGSGKKYKKCCLKVAS